jgi:NAD(P)-dependent dehydrogenase (short-subunit alcohol dehydrogenase family)
MGRLVGKAAFVTGAAGGIGRATCARYIQEGAKVAAIDLDAATLEQALSEAGAGDRGVPIACDITDPKSVKDAVAQAVRQFGHLDILCNIAGGSTAADARVTEAPDEEFWRVIKLDLYGTFLCCKHVVPEMIQNGNKSTALTRPGRAPRTRTKAISPSRGPSALISRPHPKTCAALPRERRQGGRCPYAAAHATNSASQASRETEGRKVKPA